MTHRTATLETAKAGTGQPVKRAAAHRPWSVRRRSAVCASVVAAAACALALAEALAVALDRAPTGWYATLGESLRHLRLSDAWTIGVCALLFVVGVWCVAIALSPGSRRSLWMRTEAHMRACLFRTDAARILPDAALDVPGVCEVRVRVRRRQVKTRAISHWSS
ncbi:DUF6286 domain-containing protein [Actinomycetota bacterium Odt1-20B]